MRALLLLLLAAQPAVEEGPAAREQARLCEQLTGEPGLVACRKALALGIGPKRRGPVRELLARRLVYLERWDELARHLSEEARLHPGSAEAHLRLGSTLLFALDRPRDALAILQEAVRLQPGKAWSHVVLAMALAELGRQAEAVIAFEQALQLDPAVLEARPAARAVLEAARRGERWP